MKTFLKLLLLIAVAIAVRWYFGLVLPDAVAWIIGALIACVMAWSMVTHSGKLSAALIGGPVVAAWPAGALLADWAASAAGLASLTEARAMAAAWWLPAIVARVVFAMARERDRARDFGGMALGAIVLYGQLAAVLAADPVAIALAALGAPVLAAHAAQTLLIAPEKERQLYMAMRVGAAGALACVLAAALRAYGPAWAVPMVG